MKTIYANNESNTLNNFFFDILTSEELALVKGGKEEDAYVDLT